MTIFNAKLYKFMLSITAENRERKKIYTYRDNLEEGGKLIVLYECEQVALELSL